MAKRGFSVREMGSSNTGGGKADSSGEGGDAKSDPSESGSARPTPSYSEEEKVLAFHGPLLYRAKVGVHLYGHVSELFFLYHFRVTHLHAKYVLSFASWFFLQGNSTCVYLGLAG